MLNILLHGILLITTIAAFGPSEKGINSVQPAEAKNIPVETAAPVAGPGSASTTFAPNQEPIKILVGGVELHYIERGKGEPLILLHGGQGDFRSWQKQIDVFASGYRVISYSRRYHYPNVNPLTSTGFSALTEAADLAGFIKALGLGPVHLVGTSYGAFTALAFALDHPGLVRTMVLAEPPVLQWAKGTDRGAGLYREFMMTVHVPAGKAFASGDDEGAMRILSTGSTAPVPLIPSLKAGAGP